jgi:hypothetical protein
MRRSKLAILCVIIGANHVLAAAPLQFRNGIALYPDNSGGKRSIHVVIDKTALLDSFGYWKEHKGIRIEATETEFRSHPYTYAAAFAPYAASAAMHGSPSMLSGLPTVVVGEIVEPELYGHPEKHPMFSFTFTSTMAAKLDWEGFDAESFQTIAPDFHYSSWFERNYRGQAGE